MSIFKKSVKGMLAEGSARTNQFWNKYASNYQVSIQPEPITVER